MSKKKFYPKNLFQTNEFDLIYESINFDVYDSDFSYRKYVNIFKYI